MNQILFLTFISFAFCTDQFSGTKDTRCSLCDIECQKNFLQAIARDYARVGIPQLGISVIDPLELKPDTLSLLGLLRLDIVKGKAYGISSCIITGLETNLKERYRQPEIICKKIIVQVHYKLIPAPIIGHICGWCNVNGEGNGTIVFEDWFFKYKYPFRFIRRNNGNIYLDALFNQIENEISANKVKVEARSVRKGERDITDIIISFINKNWRTILDSYIGEYIKEVSTKYYIDTYKSFYDNVPATGYFSDDLTPLVEDPDACRPQDTDYCEA